MPVDLPEETVRPYFLQLTSAVAYLHDHGISESWAFLEGNCSC